MSVQPVPVATTSRPSIGLKRDLTLTESEIEAAERIAGFEFERNLPYIQDIYVDSQLENLPDETSIHLVPAAQMVFNEVMDEVRAEAWTKAIQHLEGYLPPAIRRAAHADNPYRKTKTDEEH